MRSLIRLLSLRLFLRVLPEPFLPLLTAWEVYQLVRRRHGPIAAREAARSVAAPRRRMVRGKPLW